MLRNTAETITLDKYTNTPSYRIGFTVTEGLITPEEDPKGYLISATPNVVEFKKGGLHFKMEDKFKIEVGDNNLLTELDSLITEIQKIVVLQGVSPDIGALRGISTNLGNILTEE